MSLGVTGLFLSFGKWHADHKKFIEQKIIVVQKRCFINNIAFADAKNLPANVPTT